MWNLWLNDKVKMSEFEQLSIDDVDAGNRALNAWNRAREAAK